MIGFIDLDCFAVPEGQRLTDGSTDVGGGDFFGFHSYTVVSDFFRFKIPKSNKKRRISRIFSYMLSKIYYEYSIARLMPYVNFILSYKSVLIYSYI